ncbi:MAG: hypothetical protein A2158_05475 [Chloroflexi bacterium RBG_13_46_14]|nr:MAG: hypothetical protein A2158_05475 [Chloroflexi bacterium RBG_13_46_14]
MDVNIPVIFLGLFFYLVLPVLIGLGIILIYFQVTRKKTEQASLTCSINTDCPSGYVCAGGICVPQTAG